MAASGSPPAVVLGAVGSALSITRSLGRVGVTVHVLAAGRESLAAASRYCASFVDVGSGPGATDRWLGWLEQEGPRGAVLLPAGDEGLELVVRHQKRLEGMGYSTLEYAGDTSLAMLNKNRTYELAREAGIPCPRTWRVSGEQDAPRIAGEVAFPCAIKPVRSHEFAKHFGQLKVLVANDSQELQAGLGRTLALGLETLVTEIIPGPDHLLWTYRTYLDEHGEPLFGITTNRLRSHPIHFGTNCYVVTRRDAEVAEAGLRFMRAVGLRGLAFVELKRDPRDGELKLIECNHRFGAAQEVIRRAGLDVALYAYRRAAGLPTQPMNTWRETVSLWFPARDYRAARDYVRAGELTWMAWLRSLAHGSIYTPAFAFDDPRPSGANLWHKLARRLPANRES
jgi:D-aspartate ligase